MMVIFLVGLVSMILMRTLRKDYARYSKEDDLDDMEKDLGDEYGWKQVCNLFSLIYCSTALIFQSGMILLDSKSDRFLYSAFQVHGDVFRPASNSLIFSALVGTGYQIASVVFIVICFAIVGDLYQE